MTGNMNNLFMGDKENYEGFTDSEQFGPKPEDVKNDRPDCLNSNNNESQSTPNPGNVYANC